LNMIIQRQVLINFRKINSCIIIIKLWVNGHIKLSIPLFSRLSTLTNAGWIIF
jgi:hypothetical protein